MPTTLKNRDSRTHDGKSAVNRLRDLAVSVFIVTGTWLLELDDTTDHGNASHYVA